jgi:hypothetical protein
MVGGNSHSSNVTGSLKQVFAPETMAHRIDYRSNVTCSAPGSLRPESEDLNKSKSGEAGQSSRSPIPTSSSQGMQWRRLARHLRMRQRVDAIKHFPADQALAQAHGVRGEVSIGEHHHKQLANPC